MTASASGTNKYRETPSKKNIGTKTIQIQSVDTNAGIAICSAPSKMACSTSLPCCRFQLMFSIATVASSTKIPTAKASPPRVIMLIVSPNADNTIMEDNTDKGIEIVIIKVLRQLPKNNRIINPVNAAAITPSRITPEIAAFTNID